VRRNGLTALTNSAAPRTSIVNSPSEIPTMTKDVVECGWSEAQEDLRRVFDESGDPMWIHDDLEIVASNQAAQLQYGYSRDEFLALTVGDLAVTKDLRGLSKHRKKDGSLIDVEVTSFDVTFRGRPASLDSIVNVTDRRKAEDQAGYLELVLATVTDAVVTSDESLILTGWNAAAETTFGRRADEVLGQPLALVFRTNFVEAERAGALRTLVETGGFRGELTYQRGDGRRIRLESRVASILDGDGRRLGYVSVNRDITERRYADEAIRSLLREVLTAQEVERRRIARELHDETAQTLTSLLVGLRAIEESQDLRGALGGTSALRRLVSAALEGVKRISRGLRPSVLDDLGLQDALERLGLEVSRTNGFLVDVDATGPRLPRLPEVVETALYRVVQEALTNASKHASPKTVSVLIHRNPSEVRLVIEDDGKGFDPSRPLSEGQVGLVGIRERIHLIGGSVTVESSPAQGTTIWVSVPLKGPASA
jgi:PAS domain S-box-containing protein